MNLKTRTAGMLCFAFLILVASGISSATPTVGEQHFDMLTIGTHTYSNVTVTTKSKTYVFLLHSSGMLNVKVAELSPEQKQLFGYEEPKPATNTAAAWARAALGKIETPKVKEIEKKLQTATAQPMAVKDLLDQTIGLPMLAASLALAFVLYLFTCYCSMLICKKAGTEPGIMVWIPIVQIFPLFKAAGMSPMWFVATMFPLLNILTHVVWCVRIAKARGKGFFTTLFLLLPGTNLLAFLYLAFSDGGEPAKEEAPMRGISLRTA